MTAVRSRSPARPAVGPLCHQAVFYRDPGDYVARLAPVIAKRLACGDPVAVAVPEAGLTRLRDELARVGRSVRWIDITREGRNPGRIIPGVQRAFTDAHPGSRPLIVSEPIWPERTEVEYPACVRHEALINLAFAEYDATFLCAYDATALPMAVLEDAMATHPVLADPDSPAGWRPSARYAPDQALHDHNQPLPEPEHATVRTIALANLASGRDAAMAYAERAGLPADRIPDVQIVAAELIANAIRYGDGTARLRLWTQDADVVCEVSGTGQLTDPLAGQLPVEPTRRNGRGLLLINHFADLVRVHTSPAGTVTRAYFRLA